MRSTIVVWLQRSLVLCILFCAHSAAFAQGYVGGYFTLGLNTVHTDNPCCGSSDGLLGVYYDRAVLHWLEVGADVHVAGEGFTFSGGGPHVAIPLFHGIATPYAEGVFGSATYTIYSGQGGNTYPTGSAIGSAYGVDIGRSAHLKARLQYDVGYAGGNVNTGFSVFTAGIVFRIKTP